MVWAVSPWGAPLATWTAEMLRRADMTAIILRTRGCSCGKVGGEDAEG